MNAQHAVRGLSLVSLLPVLVMCQPAEVNVTLFEGPTDTAILPNLPEGSIFDVPVAFVASSRSGDIGKLDLGRKAYLVDDPSAGFLRSVPLPTGRTRFLEQLAVYSSDGVEVEANSAEFITLFASDSVQQSLLVVPYLDSEAGEGPGESCLYGDIEHKPMLPKYPICFQHDTTYSSDEGEGPAISLTTGSAAAFLADIRIVDGATTTETFFVTWDSALERFEVRGTFSGEQPPVVIGEAYQTHNDALAFTIYLDSGELADGDGFEIETSNGIVEIPVNGVIQDLRYDAHSGLILASVEMEDGSGALVAVDAEAARTRGMDAPLQVFPSPAGTRPGRMDLLEQNDDGVGPLLLMADPSEMGVVHRIDLSQADIASAWTTWDVGFSSVELALSPNPDVPWLYLGVKEPIGALQGGRLGGGLVRIFDIASETEVDFNPITPYITAAGCLDHCDTTCVDRCEAQAFAGDELDACVVSCTDDCQSYCEDEGIPLNGPVEGMAASVGEVDLATTDVEGRIEKDFLIGVTTYAGTLYSIEASRGCLSFLQPRGAFVTSTEFINAASGSNASLWLDSDTGRTVQTNRCGGVTRSEVWTLLYDELKGGWHVSGSESGPQVQLAYTDRRYISDGGEMSVLVLGGSVPAADGDKISIVMEDGVASLSNLFLPQDLATYQRYSGLTNEGWYEQTVLEAAVIPQNNLDEVSLIDLRPVAIAGGVAEFGQFQ